MKGTQSGTLVLLILLLLSGAIPGRAAGFKAGQDTVKQVGVHQAQSDTIGPDFIVRGGSQLVDENQLPTFGQVLGNFSIPIRGKVISRFGMRSGRMHTGTDIKLQLGDTVYAAYSGEVSQACSYYGYGNLVVLNHTHGLETYYGHLSKILVKPGEIIFNGQPLGLGGRTGRATTEHLHFEIRENKRAYNPELVYDFENEEIRPEIVEKEALADLIRNPKTGENIEIIARSSSYSMEMPAGHVAEYVIRAGDSLWEIARRFNTTVSALCKHNNLSTSSRLRIGMVLKVLRSGK